MITSVPGNTPELGHAVPTQRPEETAPAPKILEPMPSFQKWLADNPRIDCMGMNTIGAGRR